MSKRPRHSDGSSHSEKKMGIGPQSDESRARRKTSYTKEGSSKGHAQSGETPFGHQPFAAQGPGLNRNGPLGCGPSAQGFGPPGCFSSKPKGHGLLGVSSLRREQFTTKGPGLMGAGPRGYEISKPKGSGLLGNGPVGYEPSTPQGPDLLGNGPLGCEPSTNKGPGLLGAGPLGYEPSTTEGAGSAGAGRHRREPFTQQNPRLLQVDPAVKFPVWAGTGPTSKLPGSSGTGTRLLKTSPTTKGPGLMGHGPPTRSSITTPDPRPSTSPSLLGAGPIGHEPFTTQGPSLLGAGPIGHEPFTNYSSQLPSFSPVPFQTLNNNFAQGVSSESAEFRSMDMAPGLEEEPHWKQQIRELKQYIVKLENDKFQMSEQVKKMNNYIVKLQSENSRLIASNECVAGQIFKQHPQQLGERERNFVVEKVYAKLKAQNPFEVIESNSNGNSFAPHSIQNQISTDSENKSVNDEDNEIQIIEPVKKELYDPYDHLDLDDLVDLLKNFKELEKSEQESLLTYVKKIENKFPEKARILSAKYRGVM